MNHITTHTADALNRLPEQYKGKPNIEALITVIVDRYQALEDMLWQLYNERTLTNAIGSQLDALGVIVGQTRDGLSDDDYRRYLRARIATNRSSGIDADLIAIARLILYPSDVEVTLTRQGPAAVLVRVTSAAITDTIGETVNLFLQAAKMAGVRLILEYGTVDPEDLFTLDSGPGLDVGILATSLD